VLTGNTGGVTITGNSSFGRANIIVTLDILSGNLTNYSLQSFAAELDNATSTVTPLGGSTWSLNLKALAGQCRLTIALRNARPKLSTRANLGSRVGAGLDAGPANPIDELLLPVSGI
jgi:hypothetical protein